MDPAQAKHGKLLMTVVAAFTFLMELNRKGLCMALPAWSLMPSILLPQNWRRPIDLETKAASN